MVPPIFILRRLALMERPTKELREPANGGQTGRPTASARVRTAARRGYAFRVDTGSQRPPALYESTEWRAHVLVNALPWWAILDSNQ